MLALQTFRKWLNKKSDVGLVLQEYIKKKKKIYFYATSKLSFQ